jgi:hypothetical protein
VRDRLPGLRAAGLDPDARPDRDCPPLGTETAPAAPVLGRLARAAAGSGSASPNDGPGLARSPPQSPACKPSRPADHPKRSLRHRRSNPGANGTLPTRRDSRAAGNRPARKSTPAEHLKPARRACERLRLRRISTLTAACTDVFTQLANHAPVITVDTTAAVGWPLRRRAGCDIFDQHPVWQPPVHTPH